MLEKWIHSKRPTALHGQLDRHSASFKEDLTKMTQWCPLSRLHRWPSSAAPTWSAGDAGINPAFPDQVTFKEKWYSCGYPARSLELLGRCLDWSARYWYPETG